MFFSIFYLTPEKYVEIIFYLEVMLLFLIVESPILTYSFVIITKWKVLKMKSAKKKSSLSNNK